MSDISIPGLSPTTSKLVSDLLEAERIRLTDMEKRVDSLKNIRLMWRDIYGDVGELQRSAKSLYGFENPFSERVVQSSDSSVVEASANRTAPLENYPLIVKQIAKADRFLSPSLPKKYKVEAGKYSFLIGDKTMSVNYRGGNLEDFAKRLTARSKGLIKATTVQDTSETRVLVIEAIPTGIKNRLIFQDKAREFGLETGILRELPNLDAKADQDTATARPGESVLLKLNRTVTTHEDLILEYSYRTMEHPETLPPAPPGPSWPKAPEVNFRGLTVTGPENSSILPPDKSQSSSIEKQDDWTVFHAKGNQETRALPEITVSKNLRVVQIPIGELPRNLSEIQINNKNTHRSIEIANVRVYNPDATGDTAPANPASLASDAIVDYKGIEARRSSNTIDDLLDNVSLKLKNASDKTIYLKVEPDMETAKDALIRFVFSYNKLITRLLVVTNDDDAIIDELSYLDTEEKQALREQQKQLRGNSSINRLKSRIQNLVSNSYPTSKSDNIQLLAQTGISTNASSGQTGGAINFNKLRGYLEIDEEILDTSLLEKIDSLKDLFGYDSDGDLVIDSGIGYKMDEYLDNYYNQNGILPSRISSVDGDIKEVEEEIKDYKVYLEEYKDKLSAQYGKMDATLQELERSSRALDNFGRRNDR